MKKFVLLVSGVVALSNHSFAQDAPQGRGAGGGGARNTEARPAASISSMVASFKKFDGYFPFYYDEKTGKIYLEVNKFDKEFLYYKSLTDGAGRSAERGQASDAIAKFTKLGNKILLVEPNYSYRSSGNIDEVKAVENAFAKSVIWGFTPAATEGDNVLIDLTPFLVRDSQGIGARLGAGEGSGGPGGRARGGAAAGRGG